VGTKLSALTEKSLPVAYDQVVLIDSEDSGNTKRSRIGNVLLGSYEQGAYGVEWDESLDTYSRIGALAGFPCSQTLDDILLPIQANMKRCVVNDAGEVQYYLSPGNSNYKEDGVTPANLDGSDGQVMVEIPKFWYKYEKDGSKHRYWVSPVERAGFELHPAFRKGATEYDYRYFGAYPGVLYDITASAYIDGDGGGTQYAAGDKLSSISGKKPITNETRATFRTSAEARGSGWHQLNYSLEAAVQLLYITEYADFNIQAMISAGNTKFASWNFATCIAATGKSNGDGNASGGQSTTSGNSGDYVSYRGIEDIFGNIWQFLDGINIRNYDPLGGDAYASYAFLCDDPANFADDTITNHDVVPNDTLAEVSGYISALIATKLGFLPKATAGSETTKVCDYYYTCFDTGPNSGYRVVLVGGNAISGGKAGVFCVNSFNDSSVAISDVGARLCR